MPAHDRAPEAMIGLSDKELTAAVRQLFDDAQALVDSGEVTFVVLTARRLACVYELLVQNGMPPVTGCDVVSDRYLDMSAKRDWSRERVLVLDDSVILGTTLYQLRQRLIAQGVEQVRFRCAVLDDEQHAPYLVEALGLDAVCRRGRQDVEAFSLELVRGLFRQQIPYFGDFPTTARAAVPADVWRTTMVSQQWLVADVTAPLLDGNDGERHRSAYSHIPCEELFDEMQRRLPGGLGYLVDSFKVRSYVEADPARDVNVVFVPLALVRPVHADHLDAILDVVSEHLDGDLPARLDCKSWSPESKHRLVQLFLSVYGLTVFWDTVLSPAGAPPITGDTFERLPLELHFGPMVDTVLGAVPQIVAMAERGGQSADGPVLEPRVDDPSPSPLLDDPDLAALLWHTREFLSEMPPPERPSPGELTKIGMVLTQPVMSVFGWIHANREMPQRARIRELGSVTAYDNYVRSEPPRVLNEGLTGRELARALMPEATGSDPWTRALVMLGIDGGNDLGIVVPVTKLDEKRNVVYRSYRLGETAHLADKPLVGASDEEMDDVTRAILDGFPVVHRAVPVVEMFSEDAAAAAAEDQRALLEGLREFIVPGEPVERFDGEVVALDDEGRFVAHVTDASDGEVSVATVDPAQFMPEVRDSVGVGSRFAWTLFQRPLGRSFVRSSVIRLHKTTAINTEALLAQVRASSRDADAGG